MLLGGGRKSGLTSFWSETITQIMIKTAGTASLIDTDRITLNILRELK
jgi:hypothetical protein